MKFSTGFVALLGALSLAAACPDNASEADEANATANNTENASTNAANSSNDKEPDSMNDGNSANNDGSAADAPAREFANSIACDGETAPRIQTDLGLSLVYSGTHPWKISEVTANEMRFLPGDMLDPELLPGDMLSFTWEGPDLRDSFEPGQDVLISQSTTDGGHIYAVENEKSRATVVEGSSASPEGGATLSLSPSGTVRFTLGEPLGESECFESVECPDEPGKFEAQPVVFSRTTLNVDLDGEALELQPGETLDVDALRFTHVEAGTTLAEEFDGEACALPRNVREFITATVLEAL